MSTTDDLKNIPTPPPSGWSPGVMWDGNEGHVTAHTNTPEPTPEEVRDILKKSNLDPDAIVIDWSRRAAITTQIGADGELIQCWYKLPIMLKPERSFDVEELLDDIYEEIHNGGSFHTGYWRTVQIGDTHIGKSEADGAGSDLLVKRWKDSTDRALSGWGPAPDGIHLAFMGDLIEGYVSQGGSNISGTDLTLTEQMRVARHLVSETIQKALAKSPEVIVSAVPGNHGEVTRVQNRPATDSYDIDIIAAVKEAFDMTEHKDRITWYFPEPNSGNITYNVGDTVFTAIHGHQFKGQLEGAKKWWAGQTVNGNAPGAAHVLMSGHFHTPLVANYTRDKWIMFGGSLETKSTWFAEKTGISSCPSILSYDTIGGKPCNMTLN